MHCEVEMVVVGGHTLVRERRIDGIQGFAVPGGSLCGGGVASTPRQFHGEGEGKGLKRESLAWRACTADRRGYSGSARTESRVVAYRKKVSSEVV